MKGKSHKGDIITSTNQLSITCWLECRCHSIRPNNFVAGYANLMENIWLGWHAQHMNYNGFLRWAFDNWTVNDPSEQRIGGYTSGDYSLSYQSSNQLDMEIYSSVRLELIREGIEDYDKICILKENLRDSNDKRERIMYDMLMRKINEFTALSGTTDTVTTLVVKARQILNDIVTGEILNSSEQRT